MAHPPTNPTDPMVARAVKALAAFGHMDDATARQLLGMWPHRGELSEQQTTEVVEQATTDQPEPAAVTRCSICGGPIEHVTELEPAYWRHLEAMGDPHVASPAETYPQGWGRCNRCRVVRPDQHLDNGVCWWCAT